MFVWVVRVVLEDGSYCRTLSFCYTCAIVTEETGQNVTNGTTVVGNLDKQDGDVNIQRPTCQRINLFMHWFNQLFVSSFRKLSQLNGNLFDGKSTKRFIFKRDLMSSTTGLPFSTKYLFSWMSFLSNVGFLKSCVFWNAAGFSEVSCFWIVVSHQNHFPSFHYLCQVNCLSTVRMQLLNI